MPELLSKHHTILERPFMEFVPFGVNPDGTKVRDTTGVKIRAFADYLEEVTDRAQGPGAGAKAVEKLCRRLNERIRDPHHHVDPKFLKNIWNSYSYEFMCFLGETCKAMTGDPLLPFHVGEEKFIHAAIQMLGKPFEMQSIYRMFPHFGEKFSCLILGVVEVTDRSATLTMRYPEAVTREFGPYRMACAEMVCQSAKGALTAVPEKVHHLKRATIRDLRCVANGDEECRWDVTWEPAPRRRGIVRIAWERLAGRPPVSPSRGDLPAAMIQETGLLSKDHTILERGMMEFRPFGLDVDGEKIRDVSGTTVQANVECLEEIVSKARGPEAGAQAVQELVRMLNGRIADPTYHVTAEFLRSFWNSYSYEFVMFLAEFCEVLTGNSHFQHHVGQKFISPLIQTLGRPFTVSQIYRMFPHFGDKFVKGSVLYGPATVTDRTAVLSMKFTDRIYREFGPYRKACTSLICECVKSSLSSVPEKVHRLEPASVRDLTCIADGAQYCSWEFRWTPRSRHSFFGFAADLLAGRVAPEESTQEARAGEVLLQEPPASKRQAAAERAGAAVAAAPAPAPAGAPAPLTASELLPVTRTILERPQMIFPPYGNDEQGKKIEDISGVIVRANVDYLEESVSRVKGAPAGAQTVDKLCRLLNERIPDPAYHVTPQFLRNVWNSYSYEFVCYLREFCGELSGDHDFHFHVGQGRHLSPMIQILGRPFPMSQIYKLWPHFAQKFAKGSVVCEVGPVTDRSAILRLKFTEGTYRQFGSYRRACAIMTCGASKGGLMMVPQRVHYLPPATVRDRLCIAKGDEWCEWEVTWSPRPSTPVMWPVLGALAGGATFAYLRLAYPGMGLVESLVIALAPAAVSWISTGRRLQRQGQTRESLIQEQVQFVEARHEELRDVYLEQEQTQVELRRKINQLTALHRAGLNLSATVDRERLLQTALNAIIHDLHYDRAMISFFDRTRQVSIDAHLIGVPDEIAAFARQLVVPCTDPRSLEGEVLLQGKPVLVGEIRDVWERLHPLNRQLAEQVKAEAFIAVPLKVKDRVIGSLIADRTQKYSLTQDDLDLMVTVANQLAIALDNAEAYRQIEALNVGLEAKVHERTVELERLNQVLQSANEQLHELDRVKNEFFANISHEFRTPLTLTLGSFNDLLKRAPSAQARDPIEIGLRNTRRLLFLINEFLDLAKFDSGLMEFRKQCIDLAALVRAVAANFESADRRRVHFQGASAPVPIEADLGQMKKVLYNLLSNAYKFSDPDKGEVWIRIRTRDEQIELDVEDNGIGIPRDQLTRVFERFTQVERRASRRHEGTGIGLALVKEIIKGHGGTVGIESDLGRGSTVMISLPRGAATVDGIGTADDDDSTILPIADGKSLEPPGVTAATTEPAGGRPLVLVVDDNADMRGYLARLLSNKYRIILARDGVEGVEQAQAFRPELILTDLMMPRMSGHDLLKAVRADSSLRTTPVVFLTARAGSEARIESLGAGADDYIAKPFDEHEILARIGNLIHLRARERELIELQKEKMTRFLPAQIADVIFSEQADGVLKSHRAEITVVFIDLRGFTAFAETAEPEDVMAVLQEYQAEMGRLIADHHGVIERFSGDAIMIFFNDPVPLPNHAEQAVRLAVAMRGGVVQLKRKWAQRGIDLGAGIGVATGYATLGLVGFEQRRDYAAIGAVTNLAARLCGEARHGQILISERVRHFVKDLVHAEPVGSLTLKGFHKPVPAYNVAGLAEPRPIGEDRKSKKRKRE